MIIPVAGMLVALAWYSMVRSCKNLNSAKFKVIHELEQHLPAALFAYEWHHCEQGQGKLYTPITHIERWIPGIFAAVYIGLAVMLVFGIPPKKETAKTEVTSGALDINVKPPILRLQSATLPLEKTAHKSERGPH